MMHLTSLKKLPKKSNGMTLKAVHRLFALARHGITPPEITDLDSEDVAEMLDEEGIQITEGDDEGVVDFGEEQ